MFAAFKHTHTIDANSNVRYKKLRIALDIENVYSAVMYIYSSATNAMHLFLRPQGTPAHLV